MSALQPAKAPVSTVDVRLDRIETTQVREGVRSELSPAKAVTPTAQTETAGAARTDTYTRELLVDPQSREVIMRVIDEATKQVVRQVPDKALMRLRAYLRASRLEESGEQPQSERSA